MSGNKLSREELAQLQALLARLRDHADDYVIVNVGVRGPNHDCPDGNAVATVRIGYDEATSEAMNLADALSLARAKILRDRMARAKKETVNG